MPGVEILRDPRVPKVDLGQFPEADKDPAFVRLIEEGTLAIASLSQLDQETRKWLIDSLKPGSPPTGPPGTTPKAPAHVVAFFPADLEELLLKKELDFKNKKEADISETRFRIERVGGKMEITVEFQK